MANEITTDITAEELTELVGPHDLLSADTDEHGREVACIEYRDARRGYVRRELDGTLAGPMSRDELVS